MAIINTRLSGQFQGSPVAYTPVLSPGTASTVAAKWHQEGKFLVISAHIQWTGSEAATTVTLSLGDIPGNPQIELASLCGAGGSNQADALVGFGSWFDQGVGWKGIWVYYNNATSIKFAQVNQYLDGANMASGDAVKVVNIRLPIVGWG